VETIAGGVGHRPSLTSCNGRAASTAHSAPQSFRANINNAIAAAEVLLTQRPWLREDIATWRREMTSIEEDGAKVKKVLEAQETFKQSKKDLQQLSDKNPRGFDH